MASTPENLIDLGQYPRNDVELITREFMRCAYLDTLDSYIKDYHERDEADEERKNILLTLDAFEHTIAVLDGSEAFLEAIHASEEEAAEEEEFERF